MKVTAGSSFLFAKGQSVGSTVFSSTGVVLERVGSIITDAGGNTNVYLVALAYGGRVWVVEGALLAQGPGQAAVLPSSTAT